MMMILAMMLTVVQPSIPEPALMSGHVFVRERADLTVFHAESDGRHIAVPLVQRILSEFGCQTITRPFPGIEQYPESDLNRVYLLVFPDVTNLRGVIRDLEDGEWFDYVEPRYVRRVTELQIFPSDPFFSQQWFLDDIEAPAGWGISRGDSSVIVAILDTGVNWQHLDLQDHIAVNSAEDVNGNGIFDPEDQDSTDADGDQYIDNVIGWDFVNLPPNQLYPGEDGAPPDNNPMDFDGHGTHCAGDASAVTDNGEGVAGVGWRSQILPVRVGYRASDGQGYISYSIEGIYYAAEHGASVISMSYGGNYFSNTEQSAVDFAAGRGVVLVAAAGNDNIDQFHYPAHYDNVICVGATDQYRNKADFSNFGSWVDVAAPGVEIYSTTVSGEYGNMGGTSMATPITAGLCGLIKAIRPSWNSAMVEEHLKTHFDTLATFPPEMGGRHINAFKALDIVIRVDSLALDDSTGNQNGLPDYGETLDLFVQVRNSFQDVDYVQLLLSSDDPLVTVASDSSYLGAVAYGEYAENTADPLTFMIGSGSGAKTIKLALRVLDSTGYSLERELAFQVGHANWLVVNGDREDAPDQTSYYGTALDSLGESYDTWRISFHGSPRDILDQYDNVIWFTGERSSEGVTEGDGVALTRLLEDGGNLFLSGQSLVTVFTAQIPDFAETYLHSTVVDSLVDDRILEGLPDGNLDLFGPIYIFGAGGANNQSDIDGLELFGDAIEEVLFDPANPDLVAGYSLLDDYHMVVLSFGFEAINGDPPNSLSRFDVMSEVVRFFSSVTGEYHSGDQAVFRLESIYPNPFTSDVHLQYRLVSSGLVSLKVYDMLGRQVGQQEAANSEPGIHQIRWSPGPDVANGHYMFKIRSGSHTIVGRSLYIK